MGSSKIMVFFVPMAELSKVNSDCITILGPFVPPELPVFGFYDPIDFTSGMFRQKSFIQVASTDVVDGKIKSLSCWASGDLLDDIYITVDMVVFEFLPN